jgi:hypothetical protein
VKKTGEIFGIDQKSSNSAQILQKRISGTVNNSQINSEFVFKTQPWDQAERSGMNSGL